MTLKGYALLVVLASTLSFAEGTQTWEQFKFEDLAKGTSKGVALRSTGGLELAPAFRALTTTPSTYIWAIASDAAGNIYAAAGSPARVYRITPDGQSTAIFEPQELQVQALVVDKNNTLYAATAPDGRVYRIQQTNPPAQAGAAGTPKPAPSWSATPYFDPGTKYIWDLVLDGAGNMFVATGDHGEIYKVTATGQHSLFFKSDEVHIRVLAIDPKGNVIAGSDGSGLVYRISPAGRGFVLYSAPKKEITALAIDRAGNIYAAGTGEKKPGATNPALSYQLNPTVQPGTVVPLTPAPVAGGPVQPPQQPGQFPAPGIGASGGSDIYRIAPDGSPTRIWNSSTDLIYALGFDRNGRLLAGSGNRGHIFAINGEDDFTDLVKASASQITSFAMAPGGAVYASSSNLGKIFVLGPDPEAEGSYESDVFDAHIFSRWGRARLRTSGNVQLLARSGNVDNPDRNWSPWLPVDMTTGGVLGVPPARFVQWKTMLQSGPASAHVDSVLLYYLPKNVPPEIDEVMVQAGYRYQPIRGVTGTDSGAPGSPRFDPPPPSIRDRDSIGVRWTAHDDNDDHLVYSVYYRGEGQSRWVLLRSDLTDRFCYFDASLLPDGAYTIQVVASDAPSHSPGDALSNSKESSRFEVDGTPPVIDGLVASLDGSLIHLHFRATDAYSLIRRAEYSIDGADWQYMEPVGQITDSKVEEYDVRAPLPPMPSAPGLSGPNPVSMEHVVVVRAYDRFENLATARVVIRPQ